MHCFYKKKDKYKFGDKDKFLERYEHRSICG